MPSVYVLAAAAVKCGGVFSRNPWTGRVGLDCYDRVAPEILDGLQVRWSELEALLAEQRPPDPVAIAERILVESRSQKGGSAVCKRPNA